MNEEEIHRRKPTLLGAMHSGCACWAPIDLSATDSMPGIASADADSASPPEAAADAGEVSENSSDKP